MPSDKDIVEEARELLAKVTPQWEQSRLAAAYVISLSEGHEIIMSFAEYNESGEIETEFKNAINNMALAVRAPELLRMLANEVETLRKERNIAVRFLSNQGYERCGGHCDSWHERLTSPRKEGNNVSV